MGLQGVVVGVLWWFGFGAIEFRLKTSGLGLLVFKFRTSKIQT